MKLLFAIFLMSSSILLAQQGFTTYSCTLTPAPGNFKNLSAIELGAGSDVWLGLNSVSSNRTLLKYNGSVWTDYTTQVNFPIQALKYDGAGNLWIGSSTAGLLKFDGTGYTQYNTSNSGMVSNNVLSLEIVGGNIYAGTNAGISVFNGANFSNYSKTNSGISSDTIYAFEKDASNQIWIGTAKGLNLMNVSNSISYIGVNDKVYDIMIDGLGDKWLGTDASGLIRYNGSFTNASQISGQIIGANYPDKIYSIAKSPIGNPIVCAKNTTTLYQEGLIEILPQGGSKVMLNKVGTTGLNKIFATTNSGILYYASKTLATTPFTKSFLHRFDYNQFDITKDFVNITKEKVQYLDINNVKAGCNPGADIHGDGLHSMYEIPKGSGKYVTNKSSFWIGGYDSLGQLHIAAEMNRANGSDFQPGTISATQVTVDTNTMVNFNKIWKVDRLMIENFKLQYQLGNVYPGSTYIIPNEILTWPANVGMWSILEGRLAPYFDYDGDGMYIPYNGDYPEFRNADQILFWVINDKKTHVNSGSTDYLGVQIGVTAYAYNCPTINDSDKVLNNTTFYNYRIINKHDTIGGNVFYGQGLDFDSMRVGFFLETDLGYYNDDYIGCDVMNNFAFVKNGDSYDEDANGVTGYHENTPYFSVNILKGPRAPINDGIDNDKDGCVDCTWQLNSVTHLPDTSVLPYSDEDMPENNRMSGFIKFDNNPTSQSGNPTSAGNGIEFYRYMNNCWRNGDHLRYDNLQGTSASGPICDYLYPGESDLAIGYGVGGTPSSPNTTTTEWSEFTSANLGGDRRIMINSGEFELFSYQVQEFDIAMVFTQDSLALVNGTLYDKVVLDNKKVYNWYKFNEASGCIDLSNVGLKEFKGNTKVNLYPNPAQNQLTIDAGNKNEIIEIKVLDVLGKEVLSQHVFSKNEVSVNVENLVNGIYLIQVKCSSGEFYGKFIKQ